MSTFDEAYVKYKANGWDGTLGNQLFNSPWANPADSRLKPASFEGGDLGYTSPSGWTVEGADMLAYENRTSSTFSRQTLLTSFPSGNNGMPSNIIVPGGQGINTNGFSYAKLGYADPSGEGVAVDGYFYNVSDLVNMWWGDGKYTFAGKWAPYIAIQGGTESNAGQSYIGKVDSQVFGAQIGSNILRGLQFTAGYDQIPWKTDTVNLPSGVTCSNSNYQISAKSTLGVLPSAQRRAVLHEYDNGMTQIEYGGWASPYTDNYDSDPLFTTSVTQGMADRRAPGSSEKVGLQYTTSNTKWVFIATDAWYNYGNSLAPENTNIWVLDGRYRFSHMPAHGAVPRPVDPRPLHHPDAFQHVLRCGSDELPVGLDVGRTGVRRLAALQIQSRPVGVRLLGSEHGRGFPRVRVKYQRRHGFDNDGAGQTGPGPGFRLAEVPIPSIGPTDVLIAVEKAGLCGTDYHIYAWDAWAQHRIKPPLVVGHEFMGTVAAIGDAVRSVHVGERVSAEGHIADLTCLLCRTGQRSYLRASQNHRRRSRRRVCRIHLDSGVQRVAARSGDSGRICRDLRSARQRRAYGHGGRRQRQERRHHRRRIDRAHGDTGRACRRCELRLCHRRQSREARTRATAWCRRDVSFDAGPTSSTKSSAVRAATASTSCSRCPEAAPRSTWVCNSCATAERPRCSAFRPTTSISILPSASSSRD